MDYARWAFFELLSYGPWAWAAFVAITLSASYALRGPGVLLGHVLVSGVVIVLDMRWVQWAMRQPCNEADQDFAFLIAVLMRAILVNTALLPVAWTGLRWRRGRLRQATCER